MHLADATWTEVRDAETRLALLPTGSTEQHGPHAPLGTDTLNAVTVADAAAEAYDGDVVVAPPVSVGVSEEHRAFDGTLWLSPETFRATVRETIESLAYHGFDRVVVVNGHGGNVDALSEACARVSREGDGDVYAAAFTWFEAVGDHSSEMGHAGPLETAMLRYANPELVREERVSEAAEGASDRWGEWVSGVNLAYDVEEFAENGVVGDPRDGDAERGEELLDLATASLTTLMAAVESR